MRNHIKRVIVATLMMAMITVFMPEILWATEGAVEENDIGVSADAETPIGDSAEKENAENDNAEPIIEESEEGKLAELCSDVSTEGLVLHFDEEKGKLEIEDASSSSVKLVATPKEGYDLATIRTSASDGINEKYLQFTEDDGKYYADITKTNDIMNVTAWFFSTTVWDGAVDITWYNPQNTEFEISTPAQLAGLASIVNGMVDNTITEEYMIKDNYGREFSEGVCSHRYIDTESQTADLLTPSTGGQVRDIVWRLPEVDHGSGKQAEDDTHNDFLYRTIKITNDIDMGTFNWTPIGGKYAMNKNATKGSDAMVIDTRFNGIFDGQGHTITLSCDRQAVLGYGYAMDIGLIGYLGGGVDYAQGYPKDCRREYKKEWIPSVKNVVVKGTVKGRRMVGGIVGRTGQTNYGTLIDSCANYATIESTDMRGVAGICGAAWGKTIIRNCYNVGTVSSGMIEYGGICGCNGYEQEGADLFNCYNASKIFYKGEAGGHELGMDGEGFAPYRIVNSYYDNSNEKEDSGFCLGDSSINKKAKLKNVGGKTTEEMKTDSFVDLLNANGDVFVKDENLINNGYPILFYQDSNVEAEEKLATISIDNSKSTHGTIEMNVSSDTLLAYGTTVQFTVKTKDKGYKLKGIKVSYDGSSNSSYITEPFYTMSGRNVTVEPEFVENAGCIINMFDEDDEAEYYVISKKIYDSKKDVSYDDKTAPTVNSGDSVNEGDKLKFQPYLKEKIIVGGIEVDVKPENRWLEYTGEFKSIVYSDFAFDEEGVLSKKVYVVTGDVSEIDISFTPKTTGKLWTNKKVADTSWYSKEKKNYTITTARQLAGMAVLCSEGVDFDGVNIELGNDIQLNNLTKNSGDLDGGERNWIGIGNQKTPFRGTFDGKGHIITNIERNFASDMADGGDGGLFGYIQDAEIKNVTVESGSYIGEEDLAEKEKDTIIRCSFCNGANGGAIVGFAEDSTISNCIGNVVMTEAFQCGGVVGIASGTTTIENCTNNAEINGAGDSIGGIVGQIDTGSNVTVKTCTNNGVIYSKGTKVGGIVGDGQSSQLTVYRCTNTGSVSAEVNVSSGIYQAIGGILGTSSGKVNISESSNSANISGLKKTHVVGGIAGSVTNRASVIENCYNTGDVHSDGATDAIISGITNLSNASLGMATVWNCYNIGRITIGEAFTSPNVGGCIAYGKTGNCSNLFCNTSSVSSIENNPGLAGSVVDDTELKGYAQVLGDAFVPDSENKNDGYPVFRYLYPELDTSVGTASLNNISSNYVNSLAISYSANGSYDGFEVYYSPNNYGAFGKIYEGKETTFVHSGLGEGMHYYKVRVYREIHGTKYYSDFSNTSGGQIGIGGCGFAGLSNIKGKKANVLISGTAGANAYEVQFCLQKKKTVKVVTYNKKGKKKVKKKKVTVYQPSKTVLLGGSGVVSGLKKKTYYCQVRALASASGQTVYGPWSGYKKLKIKK